MLLNTVVRKFLHQLAEESRSKPYDKLPDKDNFYFKFNRRWPFVAQESDSKYTLVY